MWGSPVFRSTGAGGRGVFIDEIVAVKFVDLPPLIVSGAVSSIPDKVGDDSTTRGPLAQKSTDLVPLGPTLAVTASRRGREVGCGRPITILGTHRHWVI